MKKSFPTGNHPPYSLVWKHIKTNGEVELAASPNLHRRIKKAVIRKKGEDLVHKLEMTSMGQKSELVIESKGSILSFKLKFYILDSLLKRSLGNL